MITYTQTRKNKPVLKIFQQSFTNNGQILQADGNDHFNQKPEWLDTFLQRTFFGSCLIHQVRRNELNKYCVNCDLSACQYCVSLGPHKNHKLLKIYRHVYKDVVSLGAMEKYMDCSRIQVHVYLIHCQYLVYCS